MNLYVANFDENTSEDDLERLFSRYGRVESTCIWIDFKTGESRGFGFVEMPEDWQAYEAIRRLNRSWWRGKRLRVTEARNTAEKRWEKLWGVED